MFGCVVSLVSFSLAQCLRDFFIDFYGLDTFEHHRPDI